MALFVQEKYIGIITSLLQIADLGISGISNIEYTDAIDRKTGIQISLPGTYEHLVTSHKVYDNENNEVETTSFEIEEDESTGTRKFFNIFGKILTTIENGSILFFDEINANFHPRLVQAIILLFNSKKANSNNAQFIFTTHDTNLIDSNFLSRDQIYFLEKNKYGASRLYSLVEFKTRKEDNHEREYFEGRYGAIPFIQNLEKAFEKIENGKTEQTTKAT